MSVLPEKKIETFSSSLSVLQLETGIFCCKCSVLQTGKAEFISYRED